MAVGRWVAGLLAAGRPLLGLANRHRLHPPTTAAFYPLPPSSLPPPSPPSPPSPRVSVAGVARCNTVPPAKRTCASNLGCTASPKPLTTSTRRFICLCWLCKQAVLHPWIDSFTWPTTSRIWSLTSNASSPASLYTRLHAYRPAPVLACAV